MNEPNNVLQKCTKFRHDLVKTPEKIIFLVTITNVCTISARLPRVYLLITVSIDIVSIIKQVFKSSTFCSHKELIALFEIIYYSSMNFFPLQLFRSIKTPPPNLPVAFYFVRLN